MVKYDFYFYTYDTKDSVRIQQKRILCYSTEESLILESLFDSQLYSRYGDGNNCTLHNHYWSNEYCKIRNFLSEFERQKAIEEENKQKGKICIVCDSAKGQLYLTTDGGYIHSECVPQIKQKDGFLH